MGIVSRPVLEVVKRTVIVWNRIRMSVVTEPPVETGVDFTKLRKGKGVSAFEGADSICFRNVGGFFFVQRFPVFNDVGVSDKGGGIGSDGAIGHLLIRSNKCFGDLLTVMSRPWWFLKGRQR